MLRLRRVFSGKAARDFFRCGARIFYFPSHSEKFYAPRFSEHGDRKLWRVNALQGSCPFSVPVSLFGLNRATFGISRACVHYIICGAFLFCGCALYFSFSGCFCILFLFGADIPLSMRIRLFGSLAWEEPFGLWMSVDAIEY